MLTPRIMKLHSTAKAEQTYFAIRGGMAKRVDAASVVEAASVCGGKSHFAAKHRICPPRHAAVRDMMPTNKKEASPFGVAVVDNDDEEEEEEEEEEDDDGGGGSSDDDDDDDDFNYDNEILIKLMRKDFSF
ncbi:hypothetical protein DPMN_124180 [Dreissena polymorpha]|uniref:Uncharacterized protein n=1 Tax=Dreissena polymorpha TaxID=45954 RepID=A0A9D4GT18_DREPO|nr:hypothetical protein DPMN_124180 [Dreissena polymorpha]